MDENDEQIARLQQVRRITDVTQERNEFLLAIEGYENKPIVTIEEAVKPLIEDSVVEKIEQPLDVVKKRCRNPANGLTSNQAAAIMLYTMSWEPYEKCLFFVLNTTLRMKDRSKLKRWFCI